MVGVILIKFLNLLTESTKNIFKTSGDSWSPSWIHEKSVPSFKVETYGKGFAAQSFIKKYRNRIKLPIVWNERYLEL